MNQLQGGRGGGSDLRACPNADEEQEQKSRFVTLWKPCLNERSRTPGMASIHVVIAFCVTHAKPSRCDDVGHSSRSQART